MSDPSRSSSGDGLLRALGLWDTIALVVGTIIGSGVFLVPADIARAVHGTGPVLAVWVVGGVLTLLGAVSLAELGAAIPDAGGIYTFIARAFGPSRSSRSAFPSTLSGDGNSRPWRRDSRTPMAAGPFAWSSGKSVPRRPLMKSL